MWAVPHARRTDATSRRARTIRPLEPVPSGQRLRSRCSGNESAGDGAQPAPSPSRRATGREPEAHPPAAARGGSPVTRLPPHRRPDLASTAVSVRRLDGRRRLREGEARRRPQAAGRGGPAGGSRRPPGRSPRVSDACGGRRLGEPVPAAGTGASSSVPPTGQGGSSGATELDRQPRKRGATGAGGAGVAGGACRKDYRRRGACRRDSSRAPPAKSRRCRRRRTSRVLDVLCVSDPSSPWAQYAHRRSSSCTQSRPRGQAVSPTLSRSSSPSSRPSPTRKPGGRDRAHSEESHPSSSNSSSRPS